MIGAGVGYLTFAPSKKISFFQRGLRIDSFNVFYMLRGAKSIFDSLENALYLPYIQLSLLLLNPGLQFIALKTRNIELAITSIGHYIASNFDIIGQASQAYADERGSLADKENAANALLTQDALNRLALTNSFFAREIQVKSSNFLGLSSVNFFMNSDYKTNGIDLTENTLVGKEVVVSTLTDYFIRKNGLFKFLPFKYLTQQNHFFGFNLSYYVIENRFNQNTAMLLKTNIIYSLLSVRNKNIDNLVSANKAFFLFYVISKKMFLYSFGDFMNRIRDNIRVPAAGSVDEPLYAFTDFNALSKEINANNLDTISRLVPFEIPSTSVAIPTVFQAMTSINNSGIIPNGTWYEWFSRNNFFIGILFFSYAPIVFNLFQSAYVFYMHYYSNKLINFFDDQHITEKEFFGFKANTITGLTSNTINLVSQEKSRTNNFFSNLFKFTGVTYFFSNLPMSRTIYEFGSRQFNWLLSWWPFKR